MTADSASSPPRRFAEIAVGDRLPAFEVAMTLQRLVMEASANRDFAPIHFDPAEARGSGSPDVYVNSTFVETLLEATIRDWAGLDARIRVLDYAMKDFTTIGGTAAGAGIVRSRLPDGMVELDLWIDSARGRTVEARATIVFPSP
jgi:3-oxo-4,17-pregnadiene-20-carboxyl-CoA hydratase beta subunit